MIKYLNFNGKILDESQNVLAADNRSFRYGDGCFETMRFANGKINFFEMHMERLFATIDQLRLNAPEEFTTTSIKNYSLELASANKIQHGRMRLTLFSGNGELGDLDQSLRFLLQVKPVEPLALELPTEGLEAGFFYEGIKAADSFSHLKTNSYFVNAMAVKWAKAKSLDEAVLLNQFDRVADASIANVFIISNGTIKTPALSEGAIDGVLRRYLLRSFKQDGIPFQETVVTQEDLLQASEVFVTNAIRGISWVRKVGESEFSNQLTRQLYSSYISPLALNL